MVCMFFHCILSLVRCIQLFGFTSVGTNILINLIVWDEGVLGMQVGEVARLRVINVTLFILFHSHLHSDVI